MAEIDRLLSQYGPPVRSWPGEEALDEEALANYAAMNPAAPAKLRPDETFRGTFLPFRETVAGTHEWAVPGFLQDVWDAAKTVRDTSGVGLGGMIRPSQYPQDQFDQIIGHGMAGAMTGITGGLARTAIRPPVGTMDLGMFGGRRGAEALAAKGETRPLQALDMLEQMEKAGKSRDEIWAATNEILKDSPYAGAFRPATDNLPRFEIDDSGSFIPHPTQNQVTNTGSSSGSNLRAALNHPTLFDAYPDLSRTGWELKNGPKGGAYQASDGPFLKHQIEVSGPTTTDRHSVLLHEAQHALQGDEGFATGAGANTFSQQADAQLARDILAWRREMERYKDASPDQSFRDNAAVEDYIKLGAPDWIPSRRVRDYAMDYGTNPSADLQPLVDLYGLDRRTEPYTPREMYRRTAGETEARTVQKRQDLSPEERRSRPPWEDYDIPESQQIVRFGDKGPQMSASDPTLPLPMDEPSRLARAREMGFDTDRTWYHGTSEPGLTELQPGRRDPGIWMTTDMMNANNYARGSDASLHYLRANPGKSFVVENASDLEFVPTHNGVPLGIDNNVDIVNHAFRNGYDSVHFPDGNFSESGNTLVVRRGNQVRDVDAAFDPAKSDSTNLLASHRIPLPISREDDTARAVEDILRLYGID